MENFGKKWSKMGVYWKKMEPLEWKWVEAIGRNKKTGPDFSNPVWNDIKNCYLSLRMVRLPW